MDVFPAFALPIIRTRNRIFGFGRRLGSTCWVFIGATSKRIDSIDSSHDRQSIFLLSTSLVLCLAIFCRLMSNRCALSRCYCISSSPPRVHLLVYRTSGPYTTSAFYSLGATSCDASPLVLLRIPLPGWNTNLKIPFESRRSIHSPIIAICSQAASHNLTILFPHFGPSPHARLCRADEAGQYLTPQKQSEHHLPTPICERMDRCSHTHGIHEHPTVRHSACVHLPTFSHTFFPIRIDFRMFAKIAQVCPALSSHASSGSA